MEYKPIFISYRGGGVAGTDGTTARVYGQLIKLFGSEHVFWAPASMPDAEDFVVHSVEGARKAKIVLAFMAPNWEYGLAESPVLVQELKAALEAEVPVFPILVNGKAHFDEDVVPAPLRPLLTIRGFPLSETAFSLRMGLDEVEMEQEAYRLARRMIGAVDELETYTTHQWRRWPVTNSVGQHANDWERDVPERDRLFGRDELDRWEEDLVDGDLRILALVGEGGLGKTMAAEALWRRILNRHVYVEGRAFDLAAWVSLKEAPQSAEALATSILEWVPPEFGRTGRPLDDLDRLCRERRCFLVLDNVEDAMTEVAGRFDEPYADLDALLAILSDPQSRTASVITSREAPASLRPTGRVRVETLRPLEADQMVQVVEQTDPALVTEANRGDWLRIGSALEGNPYLAVLVARLVREGYHGDPSRWLANPNAPAEADEIYQWHWEQFEKAGMDGRLAREILLWLAIHRAPIREAELRQGLWSALSKARFERTLSELHKRFPIYATEEGMGEDRVLTVHSYILEYSAKQVVALSGNMIALGVSEALAQAVEDSIVSEVSDQIAQNPDEFEKEVDAGINRTGPSGFVLVDHPIVMATAPTAVRRLQRETFLRPIIVRLRKRGEQWARARLHYLLGLAARKEWGGYLAGNLFDLLAELEDASVQGLSAPGLRIRQADLRGIEVHDTDLRDATLHDVRITQSIGQVRALATDPDDAFVVVGDDTGTVTTWRIGEESPVRRHARHDGATVRAVAVSPDGALIASACNRGAVWIWPEWRSSEDGLYPLSPPNGELHRLHESRQLRAIAFDRKGQLATSAEGPCIWLHDLEDNPSRKVFDLGSTDESALPVEDQRINALAYDPSRDALVAGTKNGGIYEIPLDEEPSAARVVSSGNSPAHADQVWALAISSDHTLLASGGADGYVRAWSLPDLHLLFEEYHPKLRSDARSEVFCLAFLPDSHLLVSGNENGTVALWDVDEHSSLLQIGRRGALEGHDLRVRAVAGATLRNAPVFITGGFDRRLIGWNIEGDRLAVVEGYANGLMALAEAEDTLYAGYEDGRVLGWSRDADGWSSRPAYAHEGPVFCAAVNPQTKELVTGGRDGSVRIAPLDDMRPSTLGSHAHWVWSLDVAPGGQRVATCSEDGDVILWDPFLKTATPCRRIDESTSAQPEGSHTDRVRVVRFHPDPSLDLLASGGYDNAIRFWHARDGRQRGVIPGAHDWVYALAFNPDGWVAAAWGEGRIRVWSVDHLLSLEETWKNAEFTEWQACEAGKSIFHLAFLPDGRLLSAGEDTRVHVWKRAGDFWESPARTYTFTRHRAAVTALSALADGRIASGDASGTGWVWHPDPGEGQDPERFAPLLPYEGLDVSGAKREGPDGTISNLSDGESETFESLGATVRR